jgi:hypothetical protein
MHDRVASSQTNPAGHGFPLADGVHVTHSPPGGHGAPPVDRKQPQESLNGVTPMQISMPLQGLPSSQSESSMQGGGQVWPGTWCSGRSGHSASQ